ncbi:MAG: CRISPR-associated helicase Cas3', partial [Clostridia bacterium]
KRALRWLGAYHVPVIVLSATLPALRRQRIVEAYLGAKHDTAPADGWQTSRAYPLLVYSDGAKVCSLPIVQNDVSHTVSICPLADKDIGEVLAQQLSEGGCAGVIVNTVKRAQELAQALRIQFGNDCVLLYHARFLMPDRAKLEERLLDALGKPCKDRLRPTKLIVVGTQVMEQSLDIDLDLLITDLFPMDLLLQRIGRLHRHFRKRKAKLATAQCYVLGMNEASFERGASAIYGDYLLMRTKALLPAQITLPQDISPLVQAVYDPDTALPIPPAGYDNAKDAWDLRIAKKESAAKAFRLKEPALSSKYGRTINALLDSPLNVSDQRGEAAVRDSDPSMAGGRPKRFSRYGALRKGRSRHCQPACAPAARALCQPQNANRCHFRAGSHKSHKVPSLAAIRMAQGRIGVDTRHCAKRHHLRPYHSLRF